MKKALLIIALAVISIAAKAQTVYTYEIVPDTTMIVQYNKTYNDTSFAIAKYFQFQVIGADKDSVSIKWTTIQDEGKGEKNSGIQKLPLSAISYVSGENINLAGLNFILSNWGITAIKPKED